MSAPRNVNRCTPCLNSHHERCTGSAGNVGCGCIHAAPVPAHVVPPPAIDPVRVRDRLADLEREVLVQQAVVDRLEDVVGDEQRALRRLTDDLDDMRRHPAVIAALEAGS